ncbi:MAG TPA: hypothetical protein VHI73_02630 [Solirubrobacteraceae bacterium]|jgi:hypothetical protein|nr:hypothetical protein [Solirubrobacteraceae bacterium]
MSSPAADFESLLREALTPVEPPADLAARLEATLAGLTELAADELETWELSAMRDPRNWGRPLAAAMVGAGAGTALVLVRARRRAQRRRSRPGSLRELVERTARDVADEARRLWAPAQRAR